jgi:hypothetical protein
MGVRPHWNCECRRAADEYDTYAPKVLELLDQGAPNERIADYLTSVVRDRMELPVKRERDEDSSSMLHELSKLVRSG